MKNHGIAKVDIGGGFDTNVYTDEGLLEGLVDLLLVIARRVVVVAENINVERREEWEEDVTAVAVHNVSHQSNQE